MVASGVRRALFGLNDNIVLREELKYSTSKKVTAYPYGLKNVLHSVEFNAEVLNWETRRRDNTDSIACFVKVSAYFNQLFDILKISNLTTKSNLKHV